MSEIPRMPFPVSVRLPADLKQALDAEAARQACGTAELLREGAILRIAFGMANGDRSVAELLSCVRALERRLAR